MARDFILHGHKPKESTPADKRKNVFNAANAALARRAAPITMPTFSFSKKVEDDRMCWGDYYRKYIYRREWFPIHPEDLREMEAARIE